MPQDRALSATIAVSPRRPSQSELPPEPKTHVLFDQVDFVTNDELRSVLGATSATPEQAEESVAINEGAGLRALRGSFLIVAGISLLSIFPAARLPKLPGEVSAEDIVSEASLERQGSEAPVDSGSNLGGFGVESADAGANENEP